MELLPYQYSIKNETADIYGAWQYINNILKSKVNDPNLFIMDNEAYTDMK